jgi:hypothetical protein
MTSGFQCAGCGEWIETVVHPSAGMEQTYVEDCQVCCILVRGVYERISQKIPQLVNVAHILRQNSVD